MAPSLDLTAIQTRCQHSSLSATECYQRYRELGISYGPTLQGIVYLNLGEGELLARLSLPAAVAQAHTEGASYVLHPSVLDAALQAACIGLLMEPNTLQAPYLPFELEELSILRKVPTQGWAWVRWMSGSTTGLVGKGLAPYSTSTCVTMKDVSRCIYVV